MSGLIFIKIFYNLRKSLVQDNAAVYGCVKKDRLRTKFPVQCTHYPQSDEINNQIASWWVMIKKVKLKIESKNTWMLHHGQAFLAVNCIVKSQLIWHM